MARQDTNNRVSLRCLDEQKGWNLAKTLGGAAPLHAALLTLEHFQQPGNQILELCLSHPME